MFETLYYMGCLKDELRGLTWDKINLNNKGLNINIQVPSKYGSKEYGYDFPIASKDIDERNNYILSLAGIKRIRPHDFRHSCASLLINNGANVTAVAKYLRHTKIEETLNTYSHLYDNALDNVINIINTLK